MTPSLTIDGGGSTARARLYGAKGSVTVSLDEALSLTTAADEDVVERMQRLLGQLPGHADVTHVSVGLAGGARPGGIDAIAATLRRRYPRATVVVARDIDLVLAHLDGPGVALVAGTGAVVVARDAGGAEVMVDGRGFGVGDRGGGAWIGLEALRLSLRRHDFEGTEAPLLRALLEALGLPGDRGVAAALRSGGGLGGRRTATLAPVVLSLADGGDPDATRVIDAAVHELAETARAGVRRAGLPLAVDIVAAGGLATAPTFASRLTEALGGDELSRLRSVDPLAARLSERSSRRGCA